MDRTERGQRWFLGDTNDRSRHDFLRLLTLQTVARNAGTQGYFAKIPMKDYGEVPALTKNTMVNDIPSLGDGTTPAYGGRPGVYQGIEER